ncbi:MAG: cell cycle transcriptional regulator TrcR [Pseudomonadota bacterium]
MTQELPLMRKATAVWLVENTSLTFNQIANFCGLHELEVQGIADGDVAAGIIGQNPINSGQLTREEISRCESNSKADLTLKQSASDIIKASAKKKTGKYTPIARRTDKPDGIFYLLKYYPEITNAKIKKLIGTTDKMIDSIRNKTHWNMKNLKPRDIVLLGLCSQSQFNEVLLVSEVVEEESAPKKSTKKSA